MAIIRFSPAMGRSPKILKVINPNATPLLGLIFVSCVTVFVLGQSIRDLKKDLPAPDYRIYVGIILTLIGGDILFRGDDAYKFDTQFWRGKKTVKVDVKHGVSKEAITPPPVKTPKHLRKMGKPIENSFDLIAYVEYRMSGSEKIGAHLVKTAAEYKVIFGWESTPYCSSIPVEQADVIMKQVREGLKRLPIGETLTFRHGAWRTMPEEPISKDTKTKNILADWDRSRKATQTLLGRRVTKTLSTYSTYTVGGVGAKATDLFDRLADAIASISARLLAHFGYKARKLGDLHKILEDAYYQGFKSRNRLLNNQILLASRPYTANELYEIDYRYFNDGPIPKRPFTIVVTPNEFSLEGGNGKIIEEGEKVDHLISTLCKLGSPNLEDKRMVLLPGRDLVVRGAVWSSKEKPLEKWDDEVPEDSFRQILFGSSFINDSRSPTARPNYGGVWDTEMIVQYMGIDQSNVRGRARKLEEQSSWDKKIAKANERENSQTRRNLRKSEEMAEAIAEGEFGIKCSVVALVYRKTPRLADEAIRSFCDLGHQSGCMFPENEYFPHIWKETLPYASNPLLRHVDWDRQIEDYTSSTACWLPLIHDSSVSKVGLEFQSMYGSSPFFVPTVSRKKTIRKVTLGKSGSGKSLLVIAGDVVAAYQENIPTYIIDATQGEVATFAPVCDALGGKLFNARTGYFNLLQGADLRGKSGDKFEFADGLLRDQWRRTIAAIALGARKDLAIQDDYNNVTALLVSAWMDDKEIQARYHAAYDGGFGSKEWKEIPTLIDFIDFATIERLPFQSRTEHNGEVLKNYRARLTAFVHTPAGQHVSRYSDFDVSAPIVVIALGAINDMSEQDVLPYISAATALTTSAALSFPFVSIKGDEASKFSKFDCFMSAFGGYFSGGRKQGISVEVIGQDRQSIADGLESSKILDNVDVWQIARITSNASAQLAHPVTGIGIPIEMLKMVDEDSSPPTAEECCSLWCIKSEGRTIVGRLAISFFVLAISVNEQYEIAERQVFLDKYPDDRLQGYVEYGKYLRSKTLDVGVI